MNPVASKTGRASRLVAVAAAGVAVRLLFLAITGTTFEDAYISLRYAENLAAGAGLVYNPGERVFGASTPLYVLFLAFLAFLKLPPLAIAKVLAALADGATLYLWCRWLLRESGNLRAPLTFALLFGLMPLVVQVSVSGMETSFALLLITLAFLWAEEERPIACGLALGGLQLLRPDGLLVAGVVLGFRWLRTRRPPWREAVTALLAAAPWWAFAGWYYGTPVPHSIPAKAIAYNLHRPSLLPGLFGTLAELAPTRNPVDSPGRFLVTLVLLPCLVLGLREAWGKPAFRPVAVFFGVWWAYLVLPRTVLFTWYFPPLLLPAYVVAGLGAAAWLRRPFRAPWVPRLAAVALAAGVGVSLATATYGARRLQRAEWRVRRAIGLWLRENAPPDARVALEPIGYIGYFSGRRILDEVGLVSPEMVPLNRQGAGWFAEMLRRFRPDYVVERPPYLLENRTLNSGVPMFRTPAEREEFYVAYQAVASFAAPEVPGPLRPNYRFAIYERRTKGEAERVRRTLDGLPPGRREETVMRGLVGLGR